MDTTAVITRMSTNKIKFEVETPDKVIQILFEPDRYAFAATGLVSPCEVIEKPKQTK